MRLTHDLLIEHLLRRFRVVSQFLQFFLFYLWLGDFNLSFDPRLDRVLEFGLYRLRGPQDFPELRRERVVDGLLNPRLRLVRARLHAIVYFTLHYLQVVLDSFEHLCVGVDQLV